MSAFMLLSGDRYRQMCKRVGEKRNKRGRVTQVGRTVEFSLADYRAWLLSVLRTESGVARCCYCERPIAIETLVTDHKTPISRSGELTIENLAACCERCNDAKGTLTAEEFEHLFVALMVIGPECFNNVLARLAKAEKLAASHRRMVAQSHRAEPLTEDNPNPTHYESALEDLPF